MALNTWKRPKALLAVVLIVIIAVVGGVLIKGSNSHPMRTLDHPEYLTFSGNYVFSVPKNYVVDEQSIAGFQLVYKGVIFGQTLDQVYAANNISLQPITLLKDQKPATFKDYVNNTFVPGAKKVIAPDVSATFSKVDGWDVAKVTVTKNGQQVRFIYLKNGQHPVAIISKDETAAFKTIEQSATDVEQTDLKGQVASLKAAVQNTAQQLRDKNAAQLYSQADADFRAKNTQDQIAKLLAAEEVYSQGSVVINGGSYDGGVFGAGITLKPLNTDFKTAQGVLYYQQSGGKWELKAMQLPNPTANQVKS